MLVDIAPSVINCKWVSNTVMTAKIRGHYAIHVILEHA